MCIRDRLSSLLPSPLFNEDDKVKVMTWAEWMELHGYETDAFRQNVDKKLYSGDYPTKPISLIMWFIMGQASWMLSCTYEQVLNYPAKIILQFILSLGYGGNVADTIVAVSYTHLTLPTILLV